MRLLVFFTLASLTGAWAFVSTPVSSPLARLPTSRRASSSSPPSMIFGRGGGGAAAAEAKATVDEAVSQPVAFFKDPGCPYCTCC